MEFEQSVIQSSIFEIEAEMKNIDGQRTRVIKFVTGGGGREQGIISDGFHEWWYGPDYLDKVNPENTMILYNEYDESSTPAQQIVVLSMTSPLHKEIRIRLTSKPEIGWRPLFTAADELIQDENWPEDEVDEQEEEEEEEQTFVPAVIGSDLESDDDDNQDVDSEIKRWWRAAQRSTDDMQPSERVFNTRCFICADDDTDLINQECVILTCGHTYCGEHHRGMVENGIRLCPLCREPTVKNGERKLLTRKMTYTKHDVSILKAAFVDWSIVSAPIRFLEFSGPVLPGTSRMDLMGVKSKMEKGQRKLSKLATAKSKSSFTYTNIDAREYIVKLGEWCDTLTGDKSRDGLRKLMANVPVSRLNALKTEIFENNIEEDRVAKIMNCYFKDIIDPLNAVQEETAGALESLCAAMTYALAEVYMRGMWNWKKIGDDIDKEIEFRARMQAASSNQA
jgi:hypothetical protein